MFKDLMRVNYNTADKEICFLDTHFKMITGVMTDNILYHQKSKDF